MEVRKWRDAVYWMASEVRMLMERAEIEGLELGAGTPASNLIFRILIEIEDDFFKLFYWLPKYFQKK